ncbi:hypothetical protein EIN_273490 [Entamoeba invadens IP1]|uniref:Uncharacterized protein n=2 Tax=Entamoeba invadens TaxID=33085 RepID=A0A0A1U1D6_ENTIV|nr:hypothetical protein EIN_273490 [Entamoeba invadens IP1]ELP87822.1 hypothetical protein EIN_273490 [Entamoeba invadens IP1]BAN41747.1 hypothetical protein [Entamoeba invadens]|eukprot:XP_004254593.1 hypothetical protein EIN_273490 [Entamoeba invadens IP1]
MRLHPVGMCVVPLLFLAVFVNVLIIFRYDPTLFSYTEMPFPTSPNRNPNFTQPTYVGAGIDTRLFNYEGVCQQVFTNEPNNPRDLWLSAIEFTKPGYWQFIKESVYFTLGLLNSSCPRTTKVLLLMSSPPDDTFVSEMQSFGLQVVRIDVQFDVPTDAVSRRFFVYKKYLSELVEDTRVAGNRVERYKNYNKILLCDFRDVYIFADVYATFSAHEVIFVIECHTERSGCIGFDEYHNTKWMNSAYGPNVTRTFVRNNYIVSNGGMMMGGSSKIYRYINIMTNELKPEKMRLWGYDQSVHNYLLYTGKFDELNITKEYCTQRTCFSERVSLVVDFKRKILYTRETGCAPVLRHKVWNTKLFYSEH